MILVHVRESYDNTVTRCRATGETISFRHLVEHVIPNKDGCCAALWARLCPECHDELIPVCLNYDPDHNGECRNCDEPASEHL